MLRQAGIGKVPEEEGEGPRLWLFLSKVSSAGLWLSHHPGLITEAVVMRAPGKGWVLRSTRGLPFSQKDTSGAIRDLRWAIYSVGHHRF